MKNNTRLNEPEEPFTMGYIKYEKLRTYKYRLLETYVCRTPIMSYRCTLPFSDLYENGLLILWKGYACDGASGPTVDTKTFMRGPFGHDAFYQFLRAGQLPQKERKPVDKFLRVNCLEDGMIKIRAWYVYKAVRSIWGKLAAKIKPPRKIYFAPEFIKED